MPSITPDQFSRLQTLVLSAQEVKELTGWGDNMTEDYLSILRNMINLAIGEDRIADQVNINTGDIATNTTNISTNTANIATNRSDIDDLMDKVFSIVSTAINLTTSGYQIIVCNNTAEINITLEALPAPDTEVHIKRANAIVHVIGLIDGLQDRRVNVKNYSMHLIYNGTDWSQL